MKLVERADIRDVYASGLSHVEVIGGGNARFVLYGTHTDEDGDDVHFVVAKIIMPTESLSDAVAKCMTILTSITLKTMAKLVPHFH